MTNHTCPTCQASITEAEASELRNRTDYDGGRPAHVCSAAMLRTTARLRFDSRY